MHAGLALGLFTCGRLLVAMISLQIHQDCGEAAISHNHKHNHARIVLYKAMNSVQYKTYPIKEIYNSLNVEANKKAVTPQWKLSSFLLP